MIFDSCKNAHLKGSRAKYGQMNGVSKFYPERVIQIDRVELSTELSHEKSYPEELSKNYIYPNSTLLTLSLT